MAGRKGFWHSVKWKKKKKTDHRFTYSIISSMFFKCVAKQNRKICPGGMVGVAFLQRQRTALISQVLKMGFDRLTTCAHGKDLPCLPQTPARVRAERGLRRVSGLGKRTYLVSRLETAVYARGGGDTRRATVRGRLSGRRLLPDGSGRGD